MKLDIKTQTRLIIILPLILSLVMLISGVFGVNVKEGVAEVDKISFGSMCASYIMIGAFTIVGDIKRSNNQWNTKWLFMIQGISLILFLFALVSLNIDLMFTILLFFGLIYFIVLLVFYFNKKKFIINEDIRIANSKFSGELPYEYSSRKIFIFSKLSGVFIVIVAILGIILLYSMGKHLEDVLPFALMMIVVYFLSKLFIVKHEKSVEKRITSDFYSRLNGKETIEYLDKLLKEKLHKDKRFQFKLLKVEILEYLGEHEAARKIYKSLGKPNEYSEFTYEFIGLDFLDKTDAESYYKALKRIEKKISNIKKQSDKIRISNLLDEFATEIYIRFNKSISPAKLDYFQNGVHQLTRVRNNLVLGRYYFNKKQYDISLNHLSYVIEFGGELKKFTHSAQKLIDKIKERGC